MCLARINCGDTFCKISRVFLFNYSYKLKKYVRYHCQNLLQQDVLALVVMDITSLKLHQCLMALFAL